MSESLIQPVVASRAHHRYSPSKLQSIEACACYESREDKVQHERTTAGTKAHAVAESGVDDNTLGDDDAAAAAECLDFVDHHRLLMEDKRTEFMKDLKAELQQGVKNVIEVKEAYLPIDDVTLPDGTLHTTAGYVDHALIDHTRTRAKLFDWKFGMWPVEQADNNLQGIAYMLGLARRYPTLDEIEFFFKQPHLGTISHAIFKRAQFAELYLRIQVVVARAVAARAAVAKGDWGMAKPYVPNCNFCANLGRCPAVAAFAIRVGRKFHPLGIPENITPTMIHSSRDTVLGLQLAQVVACWAKSFKSQVTDRIIRGEADLPAGQVLQSKSDREIADPEKYKNLALKRITVQQYLDACTVGFGKVEEAIKDKAPRGSKKAAVDEFNAELESAGAVVRGQPYTFLRSVAEKTN